jgi:hypothetical protein
MMRRKNKTGKLIHHLLGMEEIIQGEPDLETLEGVISIPKDWALTLTVLQPLLIWVSWFQEAI